ncbi:transporter substrate-binding protein [Agrobacterium tumefaciens]|uniref:transporter substrate-binding protein n=1 Tax=Agrobacterium tumefaciens TaxID=358 RepID=UPI00287D375F|nr:transporter substrate-binding protein [Agrobacterium tumefaciens]MDS7595450.1 transporter substrate-binding protein [Agrobacterium tumefaciens]
MTFTRRTVLKTGLSASVLAAASGTALLSSQAGASETVKLGLLHSLTGNLALSEVALMEAEKFAVDEINANGGVLGRQIEAVIEDGASDFPTHAEKARKLLQRDKVAAIVGCYTSASRRAILPAVRQFKGLLYYPTFYEGREEDPRVFYTSQEASQSVIPSVEFMTKLDGKTFFIIGSDYDYPRTCAQIATAKIKELGGTVVGEDFVPLGHGEFSSIVTKIKEAKPDWIYSIVVGGSNVALCKQLKAAGLDGLKQKILSNNISENEIDGIGRENAEGIYSCMGYFQSVKNPENERFVSAFKAKYGENRVIGDPMECAYSSVYLWKLAVEKAGSFDVAAVVEASSGLEFNAPEGLVKIHPTNHHMIKRIRVGRSRSDGQFDIIMESEPKEPNPFLKS